MKKDAFIDISEKYRYMLLRQWGEDDDNFVNFIMLNPSTADDKIDDPTIKSCIRLAKGWGYDGFYVTNLFAYRSTNHEKLVEVDGPIGECNNEFINNYANKAKTIVLSWGNHGYYFKRDKKVIELVKNIGKLYCLKKTKSDHPMHPLFAKHDTKLIEFID